MPEDLLSAGEQPTHRLSQTGAGGEARGTTMPGKDVEPRLWPVESDAARALAPAALSVHQDPRWLAAESVAASRHFARSPLLTKFLLHVVMETLEGRQEAISEHQIGVRVFGRPESYRTVEDNIVRNYARQLRKRLAEHFAQAPETAMRIEIPVGGYVPVFTGQAAGVEAGELPPAAASPAEVREAASAASLQSAHERPRPWWRRRQTARGVWLQATLLLAYSACLVALTALAVRHWMGGQDDSSLEEPAQALWKALLDGPETTYVVPPDAGFNLLEDISHRSVPLAEYMHSSYNALPLPQLDGHSATDLRSQQFTDFVNVQIMVAISRLKEYDPAKVRLLFPRDLRLDDLKNANAVLIGSVCSNPWAAVKDAAANFTVVCSEGMEGSTILNRRPRPGELATYASHWNEPTHETYALISFLPNLSGSGHLLLLEGLDVAGTQAAAEALMKSQAIEPILRQARRPDGSLAPFEVLLKATSIEANATDTQVIASRID